MNLPRAISACGELRGQTTDRLGGVLAGVGRLEVGSVVGAAVDQAHSLGLAGPADSREQRSSSIFREQIASFDDMSLVGIDYPAEMVIA